MIIQVISDVHLEHRDMLPDLPVKGDILILAGDIGKPGIPLLDTFLNYVSSNWSHIIYVPGNHEYYLGPAKENIDQDLRNQVSKFKNIYYLDRDIKIIDGVRFLGCCLWSTPKVTSGLNDFYCIRGGDGLPISSVTMSKWNQCDIQWLNENLQSGDVVITHFMPLKTKDLINSGHPSKFQSDGLMDSYFGNNLRYLVEQADYWISGHTHQQFDVNIGNCRWMCNPMGYPKESVLGKLKQNINDIFIIEGKK